MIHFQAFDSFEEMQAAVAEQHAAAMAGMSEHQRTLLGRRKFYWVRPYAEMDMFIFGEYDLDAWIANEKRLWDDEDGPFADHQASMEHGNLVRGYLSGRAYSVVEPDGELGDTHVSTVFEISEKAFEQARAIGWRITPDTRTTAPALWAELVELAQAEVAAGRG